MKDGCVCGGGKGWVGLGEVGGRRGEGWVGLGEVGGEGWVCVRGR